MGADTHGEPFYENPPKQQNTIASFEDAKNHVARQLGYKNWKVVDWFRVNFISVITKDPYAEEIYTNQAAELYAESKAREAWDRACEAQRKICADKAKTTRRLEDGGKVIDKESILNAPKPDYQP